MIGKVVRSIGGFYYVRTKESGVYACRARGIFRKEGFKPLVGDDVEMSVTDASDMEGSLDRVLERRNMLIRPEIANIDQALVVFAICDPKPNLTLLDRFLISMERQHIPTIICFNKIDLDESGEGRRLSGIYRKCGYEVANISVISLKGLEEIHRYIKGRTSVLAGPSGVGKSSLANALAGRCVMETAATSRKLGRGKHTTRYTNLIPVSDFDTYLADTPGFSSLFVTDTGTDDLSCLFPEFRGYESRCRFKGCAHMEETDCGVKSAVVSGDIPESRYKSYRLIYEELKSSKKRR